MTDKAQMELIAALEPLARIPIGSERSDGDVVATHEIGEGIIMAGDVRKAIKAIKAIASLKARASLTKDGEAR